MDLPPHEWPITGITSSKRPFSNHLYSLPDPGSSAPCPPFISFPTLKCLLPHWQGSKQCTSVLGYFSSFTVGNRARVTSTFRPEVRTKINLGGMVVTTGWEEEGKGDLLRTGHGVSVVDTQNLPEMDVDKSIPKILSQVLYVANQKGDKC